MFAFLAFMAGSAAVQSAPPAPQPRVVRRVATPDDVKPVVRGADVCLPMKLADGLPVIPAMIAGRPISLGFDTGAPGIMHLAPTLISQLGLKQIGEAHSTDPSGRNVLTVGLYELHDLKLGAFGIIQWQVSGDPTPPGRFANPDGIIGLDAFRGYVVTFDYPGRRILIAKGNLPSPDNRSSFHYDGPIPRAPLTIDGRPIDAHVDTGNARYPLIVPERLAAQLPGYARRFPIGTAHSVNNKYDLVALPVHEAKIGDFPLYAGTVAFPAPATMGNIGSLILKDMVVRVDPANSIVSFERAKPGLEDGCPTS